MQDAFKEGAKQTQERFQEILNEVKGVKQDIRGVKEDIKGVREDIKSLNGDIKALRKVTTIVCYHISCNNFASNIPLQMYNRQAHDGTLNRTKRYAYKMGPCLPR